MDIWKDKNVLVLGAARQGLSLTRYLVGQGAHVTLNDQRPSEELPAALQALDDLPVEWVLGSHPLKLLEGIDLVCVSGGVPLNLPIITEALDRGILLSNDSQVFMDAVACPVVGITGSAGKTTVTTLVGRIASAAVTPGGAPLSQARKIWVGGNIGLPLITAVDQLKPDDLVILELSSFQLELVTRSPWVAAILNITPNHLDRHNSMEAYTAAKARILSFQAPQDLAVLGREDPGAWGLVHHVAGRLVSFGIQSPTGDEDATFVQDGMLCLHISGQVVPLMPKSAIRLRGDHNLQNVLAACAIAYAAGLPANAMQAGIEGFTGVPHRLQWIRKWAGADWYNDSIATAPERTIAAIRSFDEPLVLLLGGRDKKLPWDDLADLVRRRVDHLVIFGESAEKILRAIGTAPFGQRPYSVSRCSTLHQAVLSAASVVQPGDVVLLSPGGTSFDEFRDFEERGECFEKWVKELS
jgi:UDP-N-acetylmuramoylalanine--D-glutamate ligase